MRLKSFLGNISFTWKILLSYMILLIIPLSITGIYIYIRSVQSIQDQERMVVQDELLQKKDRIEQQIKEYESISQQLSINPFLADYFNDSGLSDLDKVNMTYNYLNPFMDWVKNLNASKYGLRSFTPNTRLFENQWVYRVARVEKESWFKQAATATYSKPYWDLFHEKREFAYSEPAGKPEDSLYSEISLFIPLISTDSAWKGTFLEMYFDTSSLFTSLYGSTIFKDGMLIVTDDSGRTVFRINNSYPALPEELDKLVKSSKQLPPDNIVKLGNERYFIDTQLIEPLNCKLTGLCPLPVVMKNASSARNIFVFCFAAGSILLFLISYLMTTRLTRKIKQLVKAVRKVQLGNFDISMPVEGRDEIAELGEDFNIMLFRIKQLINQVYKAEILQKDALLKSLENQIDPHFLYNTLETIKMMAEIKKERDISDALTSLGTLLRYNLMKDNNLITLETDLEHIQSYCGLQNLMLNNRLTCRIDIEPELLQCKILKLVLQPIVENAIIHGFDSYDGNCILEIVIKQIEDRIKVSIKNNGNSIAAGRLEAVKGWVFGGPDAPQITVSGNGVGLKNVHQRIQLNYGPDYGLSIDSRTDYGTEVSVIIPLI